MRPHRPAVIVAVVAMVALVACGSKPSTTKTTLPTATSTPGTTTPPTSAPPSTTQAPSTTAHPVPTLRAPYQALWPFSTGADVLAWQASYESGGHQPWHLDADATALAFTRGFLGFNEIDRVINHTITATDARVAVGSYPVEGHPVAAAVVHLIRFGNESSSPWEVVGTDDTSLTLALPAYGATVTSPVGVGGRISGVDESLRIEIRQIGSATPIGTYCCLPAGGENTPWRASVPFTRTSQGALTISVSTGGHLQNVERFAITGVRAVRQ